MELINIQNRVTNLFQIKYPIIQGGMVWVSGWKLASAVSNCGGLGLIGSGSMKPDLLREHIHRCRAATSNSFGVNIPLLRQDSEDLIKVVIEENVKIVFTSAGNPAKFIDVLRENDIIVVHVVSNLKQGLKSEAVGCNAVVGEGVEAGGHNGLDQLPMLELLDQLKNNLSIPIIAAGGIVDRKGIETALQHGAEGVQIGTLFAATKESSAHIDYKKAIVKAGADDTKLILKKVGLTRAIKNPFVEKVLELESKSATAAELKELLGEKRERKGIFEGDLDEGILEAGMGAGKINDILSVGEVFNKLKWGM
ncbi:Enoyl-[acyl-carrier-protein] reductase [FMN] [hydrothermal vent metagenome]|uniref:Enoyl-[acyl-carrier-protein] reductase [FMN] n=1 Tax=hydrothermal vent metagenome TaxID=652676 RepID=A0A3B1D0Q9_9ZZZZ